MSTRLLLAVRGLVERTGIPERQKLIAICDELRIPPDAISAVIAHESSWNPAAKNPRGSATGLIQFIESTAKDLGTSTAELAKMTTLEQLEYVRRFYKRFAGRIKTAADALMAAFLPIYVGKPLDFVIAKEGGTKMIGKRTEAEVYVANRGFDKAQKGFITVGDVTRNANAIVAAAEKLPRVAVPYPPAGSPLPPEQSTGGGIAEALALALMWWGFA